MPEGIFGFINREREPVDYKKLKGKEFTSYFQNTIENLGYVRDVGAVLAELSIAEAEGRITSAESTPLYIQMVRALTQRVKPLANDGDSAKSIYVVELSRRISEARNSQKSS